MKCFFLDSVISNRKIVLKINFQIQEYLIEINWTGYKNNTFKNKIDEYCIQKASGNIYNYIN